MYNDESTRAAVEAQAARQAAVQEARERLVEYVAKWEAGPCYYTAAQTMPNLDDIRAMHVLLDATAPTPAQRVVPNIIDRDFEGNLWSKTVVETAPTPAQGGPTEKPKTGQELVAELCENGFVGSLSGIEVGAAEGEGMTRTA